MQRFCFPLERNGAASKPWASPPSYALDTAVVVIDGMTPRETGEGLAWAGDDTLHFDPYNLQSELATAGLSYHPLLKSFHCGFMLRISAIFFSRRHPFSCFSRLIAFVTSPYLS